MFTLLFKKNVSQSKKGKTIGMDRFVSIRTYTYLFMYLLIDFYMHIDRQIDKYACKRHTVRNLNPLYSSIHTNVKQEIVHAGECAVCVVAYRPDVE